MTMGDRESLLARAKAKARNAKFRMDEVQIELEKAEDEWHEACKEVDRLEECRKR